MSLSKPKPIMTTAHHQQHAPGTSMPSVNRRRLLAIFFSSSHLPFVSSSALSLVFSPLSWPGCQHTRLNISVGTPILKAFDRPEPRPCLLWHTSHLGASAKVTSSADVFNRQHRCRLRSDAQEAFGTVQSGQAPESRKCVALAVVAPGSRALPHQLQ